jgi:hypothetical protein
VQLTRTGTEVMGPRTVNLNVVLDIPLKPESNFERRSADCQCQPAACRSGLVGLVWLQAARA